MREKSFPVIDILSVITGKRCGTMDGIYLILEFLFQRPIYTHEFPELIPKASELIIKQHPTLAKVDGNSLTRENSKSWIENQLLSIQQDSLTIKPASQYL